MAAAAGGLVPADATEEADTKIEEEEPVQVKRARVLRKGFYGVATTEKKSLLQPPNGDELLKKVGNDNLVHLNVDGTSEKGGLNFHGTLGLQTQPDSDALRLRSSSPGGDLDNKNKRPARICVFFAQGWCIKGKGCKFLHHRDGSGAKNLTKEEKAVSFAAVAYGSPTSSAEGSQLQKLSNLKERQFMNSVGSSKNEPQRALSHAYSGEDEGLPHLLDKHNYPTSKVSQEMFSRIDDSSTKEPIDLVNESMNVPMVQENREPYCMGPCLGSVGDSYMGSGGIFLKTYLDEGKLKSDVAKGSSLNDSHALKSYLEVDSLNPEYRHRLFESCSSSDLLPHSEKSSAYVRTTENFLPRHQEVHYSIHGSYGSYNLTGFAGSGFDSSVHSFGSPPSRATSHLGMPSRHRFMPSFENAGLHKNADFDKGCYTSTSGSLAESSPHYSSANIGGIDHRLSVLSSGQLSPIEDKVWETSVPFVPSFSFPESKSPPRSQCDPFVDSADPPKHGSINNHKSPMAVSHNTPSQHIENAIISGRTRRCNTGKSLNCDGKLGGHMSAKGSNGFAGVLASDLVRASSLDSENRATCMRAGEIKNDVSHRRDQSNGPSDNDKTMRDFRFRLVEFVKELVKPFWKEGNLTKDDHKMIVKKSVEKVIASFEPHQVPATEELMNDYLEASESKIQKLVKAYVDKYRGQ